MTTLRLAYRAFQPFTRAFDQQLAAFRARQPDVEVAATAWDPQDMYCHLVAGGGLAAGDVDLMLTLSDWMPQLIAADAVAPLDDLLSNDGSLDWPAGWSPSMCLLQVDTEGRTYGIAYHDGPMMLIYRGDLFENVEEQTGFAAACGRPLRAPATWSEFLEVAHWFHRPAERLAGASLAGFPDAHNNVYDFLVLLWSHGGELLDERNLPAFDSKPGRAALQFYVDLVHAEGVVPIDCLDHDSVASGEYFASGRSAMMWNWSGFSALTELPSSAIRGKSRLGLLPRGDGPGGRHTTLNVYWLMTMSKRSTEPEAAWSLLRHLATPEMDRITALAGGTATRLSTWRDEEVQRRFPMYRLAEEAHRGSRQFPPLVCAPQINSAISEMTRTCMHEGRDVAEALSRAAAEVAEIVRGAGEVNW